ncbi:MAG: hypothetical protein AB8G05_12415 [Oligoflexales bacterium]
MPHLFNKKRFIVKALFLLALLVAVLFVRNYFIKMSVLKKDEPVGVQGHSNFNMIEDGHLLSIKLLSSEQKNSLICYAGLPFVLKIKVRNQSNATLNSGHEFVEGIAPVNIGYRLYKQEDGKPREGQRHFFLEPLDPNHNDGVQTLSIVVNCPSELDSYQLSVELVQEGVAWQVDSKDNTTFINRIKLDVRHLFSKSHNEQIAFSQQMDDLIHSPAVPWEIKQVALGAVRLLESSRKVSELTAAPRYLLSEAGSQYPMVWVRDLATIQGAFLRYLNFEEGKNYHWSELFFSLQGPVLGVPDWVALKRHAEAKEYDKNTVSSDQELWLVHSIFSAIEKGRLKPEWLRLKTNDLAHAKFIEEAIRWVLKMRYDPKYSCITSGHTIDWGDVGPYGIDNARSTKREYGGSAVCSTYAQALFVLVSKQIKSYISSDPQHPFTRNFLEELGDAENKIVAFLEEHLWMRDLGFFKIHHHLEPSVIPCYEEKVFALGAQVLAFEAGLILPKTMKSVVQAIINNQEEYEVSTISGVLFPAYPKGAYQNPIIQPYEYQNGGQWDWFGARAALIIAQYNPDLAKKKLREIAVKVLSNGAFYEWEHLDGSPGAGPHFRAGAASFLISALQIFGQEDRHASEG